MHDLMLNNAAATLSLTTLGAPAGSIPGAEGQGATGALTESEQALGNPNDAGTGATGSPGGLGMGILWIPLVMLVALMLFTSMGSRKERRRRQELLASIKKGDRVRTSAGIIGSITELRDDEVVLETDKATSTRIRFARSAIDQVLKEGAGPPKNGADAGDGR